MYNILLGLSIGILSIALGGLYGKRIASTLAFTFLKLVGYRGVQ